MQSIVKSHSGNRLNPIKDYFLSTLRYRPDATNLRSSAFICGLFFADKLETKIPIQKGTRMTRIKRIFTDYPICANPRHPRYPCSIVALLFAKASEINNSLFIMFMNNLMQKILSPMEIT
jgi:hypothetical protein